MEPLVAALAKALVSAMSTGVWHQVLHTLAEALRTVDAEVADELPDDLREARAILMEAGQDGRPDAEEESGRYLRHRLTRLLAQYPDLTLVLGRFRDEVLTPLLPSAAQIREPNSRSTVRFPIGYVTGGDIVAGDVVQSINRDQVGDA